MDFKNLLIKFDYIYIYIFDNTLPTYNFTKRLNTINSYLVTSLIYNKIWNNIYWTNIFSTYHWTGTHWHCVNLFPMEFFNDIWRGAVVMFHPSWRWLRNRNPFLHENRAPHFLPYSNVHFLFLPSLHPARPPHKPLSPEPF